MPTPSFKEKLTTWETMSNNLKLNLDELPHLTENQTALEQLLAEGRSLESRQGIHTAALRETNRQRLALEKRGDELRERVAGALRHKYGSTSKRLHEFGLKPKVERRRRLTPEQKAEKLEQKRQRIAQQSQKLELQREKLEQAVVKLERQADLAALSSPATA